MERSAATVVSAPGKVLAIGGYLITERPNKGLVFSVSARMYAAISAATTPAASESDARDAVEFCVRVVSPQFGSDTAYAVRACSSEDTVRLSPSGLNDFIEETLVCALTAALGLTPSFARFASICQSGLCITIAGDRAFYSAEDDEDAVAEGGGKSPTEPKKTGLGSSAALVTALVGAILGHYGVVSLATREGGTTSDSDLALVHNLAQFCHYKAQGKIGSGFDVSSAVYGSQLYVRFSPSAVAVRHGNPPPDREGVAAQTDAPRSRVSPCTGKEMADLLQGSPGDEAALPPRWDATAEPLGMPRGMSLLLGDVSHGAKTPGMVAAVTRWKESVARDGALEDSPWGRLTKLNERAIRSLGRLRDMGSHQETQSDYDASMALCAAIPPSRWADEGGAVGKELQTLRSLFVAVRAELKAMGVRSGADIEPDSQTRLADDTMAIEGALVAGVPGAGGMDALFTIALSRDAEERVKRFWRERGVKALSLDEDHRGVLAHDGAERHFPACLRGAM